MKTLYICMGVSGCGKTTIGELLAKYLNCEYIEGDKYHPPSNIHKMSVLQQPLNDNDREAWLQKLFSLAHEFFSSHQEEHECQNLVMACSALKHKYRLLLCGAISNLSEFDNYCNSSSSCNTKHFSKPFFQTKFLFLKGSMEGIEKRLRERQNHFMKAKLLKSQFDTLEEPVTCPEYSVITVDSIENKSAEEILQFIIENL